MRRLFRDETGMGKFSSSTKEHLQCCARIIAEW
jgi:hypothetical protein